MAVELFSVYSGGTWGVWPALPTTSGSLAGSPRLSFSRDLPHSRDGDAGEEGERRDNSLLLGSPASSDFDFCVAGAEPAAAADELFAGGKLLPVPIVQIPKCIPVFDTSMSVQTSPPPPDPSYVTEYFSAAPASPSPSLPPASSASVVVEEQRGGEVKEGPGNRAHEAVTSSKPRAPVVKPSPFWRFRRSSSLNYGDSSTGEGQHTAGPISPPLLPLLSRSKSAGSNPYSVPTTRYRTRPTTTNTAAAVSGMYRGTKLTPSTSPLTSSPYYYNRSSKMASYPSSSPPRPPYYHRHTNNNGAVRISPIINVPPPYIPKGRCSGGLFGFGYLLCNGGDKTVRRRKKSAILTPSL